MDCPDASGNFLLETASSSSKRLLNVLPLLLPICPASASAFSVLTLPPCVQHCHAEHVGCLAATRLLSASLTCSPSFCFCFLQKLPHPRKNNSQYLTSHIY